MNQAVGRLVFWLPRIMCIAFAVFVSLFALDVFQGGHGFWQTALAFSIHMIPTAVIVAVLIVAWRWEWVGAAIFATLAGCYMVMALPRHPSWVLGISGPLLSIAGLFLLSWIMRRGARAAR